MPVTEDAPKISEEPVNTAEIQIPAGSTAEYLLMQLNAEDFGNEPVVKVLGTLATYSTREDSHVEDSPETFPTAWENDNPRISARRPDQPGSPFDIREKLQTPEELQIVADAVKIADALAQASTGNGVEFNITPPDLQGPKSEAEVPPDDKSVLQRLVNIHAMIGASQGKNMKTENEAVAETHFQTRIPGYSLVQRVIISENPAMVQLPSGMTEVRGKTVLLSLQRSQPAAMPPAPRQPRAGK